MRLSRNYIKAIDDQTREYDSINHELLTHAGFIDQTASGVYTLLAPGLRVIQKIEQIIREELNKLDAHEILMPSLQPKALWDTTRRWNDVDVLYKVTSQYGYEYGLAPTAEEVVTDLATHFITSYKDLPVALYQISSKFRDEARAKSGILRGREFRMKDLYSFHASQEDFEDFYAQVSDAYMRIFARCGLDDVKITEAGGGDFSKKHSHEFNVITPAGEADLYYTDSSNLALNEEVVHDNAHELLGCSPEEVKQARAIEVGNIFDLSTRFSESFDLKYVDEFGKKHLVTGGCYGIGITRLMGAIAEVHHDDNGMLWPDEVRPFDVHLVNLSKDDAYAGAVYRTLKAEGIDVLYDDRDVTAGKKFITADLIGVPIRLVVSDKNGENIEWKERSETSSYALPLRETIQNIKEYYS